jgi:hypothetical protein
VKSVGELLRFDLPAGISLIEFAPREPGVRLDQILITDDPTYQPTGRGAEPLR